MYMWLFITEECASVGASHMAHVVKDTPAIVGDAGRRHQFHSLGQEDLLEKEMTNCHFPVLLPGKSHGQRCLGGYSPWEHKELGTTYRLTD